MKDSQINQIKEDSRERREVGVDGRPRRMVNEKRHAASQFFESEIRRQNFVNTVGIPRFAASATGRLLPSNIFPVRDFYVKGRI